jgi:hypothetical protein
LGPIKYSTASHLDALFPLKGKYKIYPNIGAQTCFALKYSNALITPNATFPTAISGIPLRLCKSYSNIFQKQVAIGSIQM